MPPKRKKTVNDEVLEVEYRTNLDNERSSKKKAMSPNETVCDICKSKVLSSNLSWHTKNCKQNLYKKLVLSGKKYKCDQCTKNFLLKKNYISHLRKEHSKARGRIACSQCSVVCPNKTVLEEHILKFHDRDSYECINCNKKFVRRSHVIRHMAQMGCDGKEIYLYPCEICNRKFRRKDNLLVHLRSQHIMKSIFRCKQCSYHTNNFSKFIIHHQKKHLDGPLQLECDHCGKITRSRAAMAKHLEIHGEKKFECDVCGYKTYTVEVMRRHILTHLDDKPYKCTECNNSYIQSAQLKRHMLKHTDNVCDKCGQSFNTKANLLIHQRTHLGLKRLVCHLSDCKCKEFTSEAALKAHMRTHAMDKPYKCEICHKSFITEPNIRRHMATHTLDKPRRCMYCMNARAYVRGEQLVKHVRKHHPEMFREHLRHVRHVMGSYLGERVSKSELESVLNLLDAEADRILEGCSGEGIFYGGMQDNDDGVTEKNDVQVKTESNSPLMSETELIVNLGNLLSQLIDSDTLKCFGWPSEDVDVVLEKVIEHCGARAAEHERWTRVQRLRENAKRLFLYVIEDKTIARMLDTHTIDQIINHILEKVSE